MNGQVRSGLGLMLATIVVSAAIAGYFIGLQSPMHPHWSAIVSSQPPAAPPAKPLTVDDPRVIPASHYAQIGEVGRQRLRQSSQTANWDSLRPQDVPLAEPQIAREITPADLNFALESRQLNRAFNGAPPTIPHPIDQMSVQACMICHAEGLQASTLRASKMSHQFLSECTQCHVENNPQHQPPVVFRESTFVGRPAPRGGPRAYPGAPPQIPHSTWMRVDCLSCHGPTGHFGIRTTHPWRQECQQCHAPSAMSEQVNLESVPGFLEPPRVSPP